jgi:hypothetical protein
MIDIDVVRDGQTAHLLHWYQPDLALLAETHELAQTCSDQEKALYGAPEPPSGSTHRYVELVFRQPPDFQFPSHFKRYLEPTIPARLFFNVTEFVSAAHLKGPVAANYFTVSGSENLEDQQVMEL